jgi:hypothetical protein
MSSSVTVFDANEDHSSKTVPADTLAFQGDAPCSDLSIFLYLKVWWMGEEAMLK